MSSPSVSVVIPNFNYGPYLGQAITSVLDQTFQSFEVLVIDNFSTDESEDVAHSFEDPRIRFERFSNGGSIARARNHGIALAQGEYIAFLDSDDKWHPRKLERQLGILGGREGISFHRLKFFDGRNFGTTAGWQVKKPALRGLLRGGNPISTSSVVASRKLLIESGLFPEDPELFAVEDFCLWLKLAAKGADFYYINKSLGSYRIHASSSSSRDQSDFLYQFAHAQFGEFDELTNRRFDGFISYMKGLHCSKSRDLHRSIRYFFDSAMKASYRYRWRSLIRLILYPAARWLQKPLG